MQSYKISTAYETLKFLEEKSPHLEFLEQVEKTARNTEKKIEEKPENKIDEDLNILEDVFANNENMLKEISNKLLNICRQQN